ncbi:MAG: GH92 family glycosyl hydrolase [Flavobacteriales bacterium]|nr:GH92 family glycosyl hydrolase [Flavobacteriales bacterium]
MTNHSTHPVSSASPAPLREGISLLSLFLLPTLLFSQSPARDSSTSLARDLVNPFIGTGGHGHTFPGACVPNGLVQLSPDTRPDGVMDWDGCGGYHYSDSVIYGFSHTHLSGTGVADLCDVLLIPYGGDPGAALPASLASYFDHEKEEAYAGYYNVYLHDARVNVELTTTARTGVHRYTFDDGLDAWVHLDLEHRDKLVASSIRLVGNSELVGERRSSSWARDQRLFYCIRFSASWAEQVIGVSGQDTTSLLLGFGELRSPLTVKVGISAVSIEGARANLDAEVPHWDFDLVRKQAEDAWNGKLNKIKIEGGTKEQQRIFYTALYHCYVAPYIFNDVDGNYRGMDGEVHHADHNVYTVFSLWDTFRALHPLMTILEPEMTSDFIKTFLLHYQQGGRLPVWELWGNETDCMIGYHSVSVIADAYMKGIRGFDADLALEAMVASAMRDEPGLNAYRTKGYISSEDQSESVSKTLEYAYDDWCIAQMAIAMREQEKERSARYFQLDSLVEVFWKRASNYQNVFNPRSRFFQARMNGGFKEPFDPFEVNFNYTEANAWQYSMAVQQGQDHLQDLFEFESGFGDRLGDRLDALFNAAANTTGREQADITGLIGQYAHGNEPSHHMAYLYNAVDKPWKTAEYVHRILTEFYHDAPDGLIGNEDCGQMSAWFVLSAMGFYPISPGSEWYSGGTPLFDRVTIDLPEKKKFQLITHREHPTDILVQTKHPGGWGIKHERIMAGDSMVVDVVAHFDPKKIHSPSVLGGVYIHPSAVPFIQASSRTFTDSLQVTIGCLKDRSFTYRVNGMNETAVTNGSVSFFIQETSEVKAWNSKAPVIAHFSKIDGSRSITLESTYANQYSAGGDRALIDGLRGGEDFRTGEWQGYQGQDVVVMIDLGKMVDLKRVGLSALQDQKSWIWLPSEVTIATSTNQRQWSSTTVTHDVEPKAEGGILRELWTGLLGRKARYIAITAKSAGPCPDWHPGKGGATWIFVDEVLIETEEVK